MPLLRDWNKVWPIESSHLQEPVEALRPLLTLLGGEGISAVQTKHGTSLSVLPGHIVGWFLGFTTNTGPSAQTDWNDERYWVQPAVVDLKDGSDSGVYGRLWIGSIPSPQDTEGHDILTLPLCVSNLCESPISGGSGSHWLPKGTPIIVYAAKDLNKGDLHFFTVTQTGSSGGMFPAQLTKDGGADGSAVGNTFATWTYTITSLTTGIVLATNVPLFKHRQIAGPCHTALSGLIFTVTSNSIVGFGGSAGHVPGSGSGGSGSGGTPLQPYRIWDCDEYFDSTEDCTPGVTSGSGGS